MVYLEEFELPSYEFECRFLGVRRELAMIHSIRLTFFRRKI